MPDSDIPFIDVNNIGGARVATEHLLSLGHTRIGIITNAPREYTASSDRLAGYKQALAEGEIAFDEALVRFGNFTMESGAQAMAELLRLEIRPTAVFIASDTVALGALQAIQKAGLRVPQDMAICGFDDISFAKYTSPPLTTIQLPAYGLGWAAAEMLIRMISREEVKNPHIILSTELVIRDSCGARHSSAES